jgi:hypothetical protein
MRSHSHQRGTSRGSPTPKTERAQTALTAVNERVRYKLSHHVVTLLKDIQGKISDKKTPTKGTNSECYMFSRSGTCKHGDRCRYEHAESSAPPAYPSSPAKRRALTRQPRNQGIAMPSMTAIVEREISAHSCTTKIRSVATQVDHRESCQTKEFVTA